jgi:hypothetical protein
MIGGINISLGVIFVGAHVYEEMVQETPEEKLAHGDGQRRGKEEEGQPTETVMEEEKEKTLKYSQEMKEEEAHTVVSQRNVQEEHSDAILTQWEKS